LPWKSFFEVFRRKKDWNKNPTRQLAGNAQNIIFKAVLNDAVKIKSPDNAIT